MALINKIEIIEVKRNLWSDRSAYVFSDTGIWKYTFEHRNEKGFNSSWEDDADYIDNVCSDFLNEAGENGEEIETTELFEKVTEEELLESV
jgi:hypothetical protein